MQRFEGHGPARFGVFRGVDFPHATFSKKSLNAESVTDQIANLECPNHPRSFRNRLLVSRRQPSNLGTHADRSMPRGFLRVVRRPRQKIKKNGSP
jgi:hypothetical protein